MSKPIEYDIRADGRVWIDDGPVDATQYPVLDLIIRDLAEDRLERFTNYPYPDHNTLYAPGGSWVTWSGDQVASRVDERKFSLEDLHYCKDHFQTFIPLLNEGALDRTGAALGPLEVTLDFAYRHVLLFRDRNDKVARFSDDGPDDRPLSKHLATWGMRLLEAVREAGHPCCDARPTIDEGALRNPLPKLRDALLCDYSGRQDPEKTIDHAREIATILSELPDLLEALR